MGEMSEISTKIYRVRAGSAGVTRHFAGGFFQTRNQWILHDVTSRSSPRSISTHGFLSPGADSQRVSGEPSSRYCTGRQSPAPPGPIREAAAACSQNPAIAPSLPLFLFGSALIMSSSMPSFKDSFTRKINVPLDFPLE